ncbi:MAG: hypothetical protein M3Z66_16575 [Chloroflexota bacterium]|nr:hypothetical protein [Chloroflexota bacterium]
MLANPDALGAAGRAACRSWSRSPERTRPRDPALNLVPGVVRVVKEERIRLAAAEAGWLALDAPVALLTVAQARAESSTA